MVFRVKTLPVVPRFHVHCGAKRNPVQWMVRIMQTITWEKLEEEQINEQVTRRMFWGDNVMVCLWKLAPGVEFPVHDHVAEQVTMIQSGAVTLTFADEQVTLNPGEMLVIPPSKPHGVKVGSEGAVAVDLFSPIRRDFIEKTSAYLGQSDDTSGTTGQDSAPAEVDQDEAYRVLFNHLRAAGIRGTLDEARNVPLEMLARLAFERECLSMGQLRKILGLDKKQAKELLRQWKHGDDHSEASLRRKYERMIILQEDARFFQPKSDE